MPKKPDSTVTLTAENWKAIMEIIRLSCKSRGEDWVKWGNGINQKIQSAIDKTDGANQAVQRVLVESGKLNSIGYDLNRRTLEIQYDNGEVYQYYEVPQVVYSRMMNAEFTFGYFSHHIKYRFKSKGIGFQPLLQQLHSETQEELNAFLPPVLRPSGGAFKGEL